MPAILLSEATPAEAWRPHLASGTLWVMDDDGPIAFLAGRIEDGRLHIDELDVQLDRQGQGLGRRLLSHAADWARSKGLEALSLTTFRNIPWNAPFYARFGFQEWDPARAPASIVEKLEHEAAKACPTAAPCECPSSASAARTSVPAWARSRARSGRGRAQGGIGADVATEDFVIGADLQDHLVGPVGLQAQQRAQVALEAQQPAGLADRSPSRAPVRRCATSGPVPRRARPHRPSSARCRPTPDRPAARRAPAAPWRSPPAGSRGRWDCS